MLTLAEPRTRPRTWNTVAELRAGRLERLSANAEAACAEFRALDALGNDAPDHWVWAACERDLALRELAHWHPDDEVVVRERADDDRADKALTDACGAIRAGRIMRKPLDPRGWAVLASTDATGELRVSLLRRLTAKLLADGVDPDLAAALAHAQNVARCSPPLPRAEVERIVDAVCDWRADRIEAGS
ncbi:MAG: primase C-terminal domain-containing protein [Solirubrobacteraceae bacterium]